MSGHTTFCDRALTTSNAFKHSHALQHEFIALNVNQVGAGQTMLGDENWFLVPLDIREKFGCLTLESGYEFSTHGVTLQYHFGSRKEAVAKV